MVNTLSSYKDIFTLISFYVNYKLLDSKLNRLSTLTSEIRSSFKNTGKPVELEAWREVHNLLWATTGQESPIQRRCFILNTLALTVNPVRFQHFILFNRKKSNMFFTNL